MLRLLPFRLPAISTRIVADPTESTVCHRASAGSDTQPLSALGAFAAPNMSSKTICSEGSAGLEPKVELANTLPDARQPPASAHTPATAPRKCRIGFPSHPAWFLRSRTDDACRL